MTDKIDYTAEMSLLLTDMQGEQGDAHEILMRVQQIINTMRAEGLPVPEDLKKLANDLGHEFEEDAMN